MTIKRHSENPFLDGMIIPVGSKQVRVSRLGKDNHVLVNNETGEELGTHVSTYKKVDTEKFVKLFTANIAMTFDLNAAGIKAFNVLLWAVQNTAVQKDLVALDSFQLDDFMKAHNDKEPPLKLSLTTFKRGLSELEKAQVIAKAVRQGWYYINPSFVFSGDRIAFTTIIERERNSEKSNNLNRNKNEEQLSIPDLNME